jgi:hypothetical protein
LFGDLPVENVSEFNRKHIYEQCVYLSACSSYPHSRACPLIGSFLLEFTYCDGKERENDRSIIFRCSFIGYFFLWIYILTSGNMVLYLTMVQKRKGIETLGNLINTQPPRANQIASCFDALSITYSIISVLCNINNRLFMSAK